MILPLYYLSPAKSYAVNAIYYQNGLIKTNNNPASIIASTLVILRFHRSEYPPAMPEQCIPLSYYRTGIKLNELHSYSNHAQHSPRIFRNKANEGFTHRSLPEEPILPIFPPTGRYQ